MFRLEKNKVSKYMNIWSSVSRRTLRRIREQLWKEEKVLLSKVIHIRLLQTVEWCYGVVTE